MDFFSSDSADGLNITCTLSTDNQSVFCNGEKYLSEHSKPGPTEYMFYVYLVLYIVLVALAGLFSGLVLGLISLDIVNLEVLVKGGKPRQRKYAKSIIKLVRHQHWLLVTLLIAYAATLEALPICLNAIVDEITAVVVSITAVLLFGEILPNAICARYGLIIGYYFAPLVWVMMVLFFPLAYPIALCLDCTLGPKPGAFFRRTELRELVKMHGLTRRGDIEEPLSFDEVLVVRGALEMRDKTVGTAMTPLDSVYMLNMTDKLDRKKIEEIVNKGFSRIPTYESERSNVVGRILAKQLLRLDPRDASPVKLVEGAYLRPPSCLDTMPLYDLLKKIISDKGQSGHLYLVYEELKDMKETDLVGIITLEDVIEELIGEEIVDETDMYVDVHKRIAAARAKQMYHQFYSTYASPSGAGSSSGVTSSATHDRNNSLGAGSADAVKRKRYGRKGNSHLVQTIKPLDSIPEDQESPISKSMPFSKQKGFGYGGIN